jgi:hypothetical protein
MGKGSGKIVGGATDKSAVVAGYVAGIGVFVAYSVGFDAVGSATAGTGVGFDAVFVTGGLSGYHTFVPGVLLRHGVSTGAAVFVIGVVDIDPFAIAVAGGGDVLLPGVATLLAGKQFSSIGGTGGGSGYHALIPAVFGAVRMVAKNALPAVMCAIKGVNAVYMIRKGGDGFFICMATNTGKALCAGGLAGGLQGYSSLVHGVCLRYGLAAVCADAAVTALYGCPGFHIMDMG